MFWFMDTANCKFVPTMREVLKRLTPLPPLMQNHSGGDGVALGIDHPPSPLLQSWQSPSVPLQRQLTKSLNVSIFYF